jgi:thiol-disulfide isomerase/thioredoxin
LGDFLILNTPPMAIKITIISLVIFGLGLGAYKYLQPTTEIEFSKVMVHKDGSNEKISLASLQGKATIVAFFQTWCTDCIREMPTLVNLQGQLQNPDLKVIMVTDEDPEKLERFKAKFPKFTLDFYISDERLPSMGINRYPTTYLLDRKGGVKLKTLEGYDWSSEQAVILVKSLLK